MSPAVDPSEPPSRTADDARSPIASDPAAIIGVSMTAFAVLSLIALCTARALAPALPGSATGIAALIAVASFVAACSSQLVAAGGIALCLRLLGNALMLPALGVAFRMLILPITLGVIALVVGSAARALDPNLGRILSILCALAPASAAAILLSRRATRAVGLVLVLAAAGAAFDLAAYETWRRAAAIEPMSANAGRALAGGALGLDAAAAVLAFAWAAGERRRAVTGIALAVLGISVLLWMGDAGAAHSAPAWQVVLHRTVEGLARRPVRVSSELLADLAALLPIVLAAALLAVRTRNAELRAALALCLLGRSSSGAPAAALLSVGATLLAVPYALQEKPERLRPKLTT